MKKIDLIEQVLVALKSQWEYLEDLIAYDDQAIDALRGSGVVRILGTEFYCIAETEINGSSLHRVEEKLKVLLNPYSIIIFAEKNYGLSKMWKFKPS